MVAVYFEILKTGSYKLQLRIRSEALFEINEVNPKISYSETLIAKCELVELLGNQYYVHALSQNLKLHLQFLQINHLKKMMN